MSKISISDIVGRCGVAFRPLNRVLTLGVTLSILAGAGTACLHRAHNEKIVSEHFDASTARIMEQLRRQMRPRPPPLPS